MIPFCDGDFRKWDVLNAVEDEVLKTVELVQIFGLDADSAFYIIPNDEVYAIGNNLFKRLGIGDVDETSSPVRVPELCGKQVKCFTTGSTHGMALTRSGEVYAWGGNSYGQIGNGSFEIQKTPTKVKFPNGAKIKEIASADRCNLALSVNDELYHWGDIGWDSAPVNFQNFPILLYVPFDVVITSISCGSQHAAAVSEKGQVLTWGKVDFRQRGSSDPLEIPTLVSGQLQDQCVLKVTCSCSATLALTSEGTLYAWGYNKNSALGTGDSSEILDFPQRVLYMNNIVDIASTNMHQMLCAKTANPETYYTWVHEEIEPSSKTMASSTIRKKHATLHDAFEKHSLPIVSRKKQLHPPEEKSTSQSKIRDIGQALFNKKENSDLIVTLADGKVYVHTLIMKTFSEHFKTLLDENWSNGMKDIDMTQYNPKAYRAFLQYIYTGSVSTLEGLEIIALYDIAVSYFENELKSLCIKMFNDCLTKDNICSLYAAASGYHSELIDRCAAYASTCIESIILSKGFENLDPQLCKSLVLTAMKLKQKLIKQQEGD